MLLTTLTGGCSGPPGDAAAPDDAGGEHAAAALPPPPGPTRGYVVISIDTLRADHLGCYGYPLPTSPFLDSLARQGTLFEQAYAQFPSTLVSHMTLFTGLQPREHGVFPPNAVLASEVETFPEVFSRHGFATGGFTEGGYMSGRFGFRRGFDHFLGRDKHGTRQVTQTFARGVAFLEQLPADKPFLLFLHTYAVHTPYDAPETYQRLFWQGEPPPGAVPPTTRALVQQNLTGDPLPPRAVAYLTAAYDAGIRETDEVLRGFFADLERLGLRDRVTVVITSDHGEELQEHGRFNHTQLYREVLRVPLLVLHPERRAAVRQPGVTQLADLAPTLYELAGLTPGRPPSGRSRARAIGVAVPPAAEGASAWADGENGERALYRQQGAALHSLLLFDPPAEQWMGRRLRFDAPGGPLRLLARSYGEPRRLRVRVVGEGPERELPPLALRPRWQSFPLALPAGRMRVVLEADGCAPPPEEAGVREPRCFAFQLRGVRPSRLELYDVIADPAQQRDLSRPEAARARRLLAELVAFRPRPRGGGAAPPPLDPELAASLRALGYLD